MRKSTQSRFKYNRLLKLFSASTLILSVICLCNGCSASLEKEEINNYNRNIEINENKKTVVIDIGHGGKDQGTQNEYTSLIEKDINLQIGLKVIEILNQNSDLEIIPTRTTDEYLSLSDRADLSNEINADLFISLHCNADSNGVSSINGVETFYWKEDDNKSYDLAQEIQSSITSNLEVRDRGVKQENYAVITNTNCPAVLIEMGFLSNVEEGSNLGNDDYQDIMAKSIAQGIENYLIK